MSKFYMNQRVNRDNTVNKIAAIIRLELDFAAAAIVTGNG